MAECACHQQDCVLCAAEFFTGLSQERVCEIQGLIAHARYPAGKILFQEDQPGTHLYLLRRGHAKLLSSLPDGRQQLLRVAAPGHLIGFESTQSGRYPYTAEALTDVEVCTIRHDDLVRIAGDNPEVCQRIIGELNEELEQSIAMIRDLGLKNSRERVASFLLSLLPRRGDPAAAIPLPLSRQEIAQMLGLTAETVSRVMAELQREGVISAPRGSLRILDAARLRAVAGEADASSMRAARAGGGD